MIRLSYHELTPFCIFFAKMIFSRVHAIVPGGSGEFGNRDEVLKIVREMRQHVCKEQQAAGRWLFIYVIECVINVRLVFAATNCFRIVITLIVVNGLFTHLFLTLFYFQDPHVHSVQGKSRLLKVHNQMMVCSSNSTKEDLHCFHHASTKLIYIYLSPLSLYYEM